MDFGFRNEWEAFGIIIGWWVCFPMNLSEVCKNDTVNL